MATWNHNSGFSLIGVLLAVVLLAGTATVFARLITSRSIGVQLGRQTMAAAALARDGVELVRALRDSNWFAGRPWLQSICESTDPVVLHLDAHLVRDQLPIGHVTDPALWRTARGEWVHDSSAGNTPTGYSRRIAIDCSTMDEEPAFVLVETTVEWNFRGTPRSLVLKEKFFNWFL